MKKTYITMITAMAIVATMLTACGKPATVNETTEYTEPTVVEETTEETVVEETEAPVVETRETEETTETTVEETTNPNLDRPEPTTVDNANEATVYGTLEDINRVCALRATVEYMTDDCVVNVNNTPTDGLYGYNPYDVVYNYGNEYENYVNACDWTLVFDAEYYKTTFPMLALQYHDDDALLLKHFQTVGIHEGRQGNANFNVCAYMNNCTDEVYNAFGRNFAAYYVYYMMNVETESAINTVTRNSGKPVYQQMTCVYTALQTAELNGINGYRAEVNVADIAMNSELCALANYRAYLNAHDGYEAHDWAINNDPLIQQYLTLMGSTNGKYAENTITQPNANVGNYAAQYRTSEAHYNQMINGEYNMVGCSNLYYNATATTGSQFDVYALDLNTVI